MWRNVSAAYCVSIAAVLHCLAPALGDDAQSYRHVLISAATNYNPADVEIRAADVTPECPVAWSVVKHRLAGGKQDGVDVVTIDNGTLQIVVVPTRGMGIWSVTAGEVRIGWDSPVGEIVHPGLVELTSRGGLGWLEGFGEWMCRCGLENTGHPGPDVIRDNTGAESTIDLTLHGKIAYLPAQEVEIVVDRRAPYTIRLRGVVHERMMHGPKLTLETELAVEPGASRFRLIDEIVNRSAMEAEFQILYHTNFGPPVLEAGAIFYAPVKSIFPMNARAAETDIQQFPRFGGPEPGFVEQVYCGELFGDEEGRTRLMLHNSRGDLGVSMSYSLADLPYITLWKNTAAVEDGYVTGIEPGTGFPYNRRVERKHGRVPRLAGGERRRIEIEFGIHRGTPQLVEMARQIERIRADRPTEFHREPQVVLDH